LISAVDSDAKLATDSDLMSAGWLYPWRVELFVHTAGRVNSWRLPSVSLFGWMPAARRVSMGSPDDFKGKWRLKAY
jgi:hypothetical protein